MGPVSWASSSWAWPDATAVQPETSRKSSRVSADMKESAELDDELVTAFAQRLAKRVDGHHGAAFAVSIRFAHERQWSAVARERLWAVPAPTDAVAQLHVATRDVRARGESVKRARHHRVDADRRAAQAQAEQALAHQAHRDSCATRVHAPAAFHPDPPPAHGLVT